VLPKTDNQPITMAAVVAGSTGLVVSGFLSLVGLSTVITDDCKGAHILSTILSHPAFTTVSAFTRRKLPSESPKLSSIEVTESETWPSHFPKSASIFLSALGTTRAQAGGVEKQRKIDLDLNLALAKAAKESGVQTYVLISSAGTSSTSMMPYSKMKGELEDSVKEIGFKHTVILRPGLIVGQREDSRPPEFALRKVADFFGAVSGNRLKDFWAQDAEVIARAAVHAGLECLDGKKEEGVWEIGQADIVRLGRTEWKTPEST
jgi:hypothetical protein